MGFYSVSTENATGLRIFRTKMGPVKWKYTAILYKNLKKQDL